MLLANRGLGGIDGTVSTAAGIALARPGPGTAPVRALLGDLTLLHDAGGLLTPPTEQRPHLQLVVADDGGGGIFETLEPGALPDRDVFERVFATPPGVDLQPLCEAYRVGYRRLRDVSELRAALAGAEPGITVLHLPIVRAGLPDLAARITAAVRPAVDAALAAGPGSTG